MAKEGRVQPHSPGVGSSFDVLAQADNSLERRIDSLEAGQRTNRRRALTVITPGSPFIIGQIVKDDGIEVTCAIELPPASSIEWIVAIYRITSEGVDSNKEQRWDDIPQSMVDAAHFEGKFKKELKPNEEYGLVALIARGDFPSSRKTRNPEPPDDSNFLTTWHTIGFFTNDPSKPDIGLLVENKTDDVTKAFDAFIVERVYAPINGILTAYTGDVTINGTTTVTGTATFVGEVEVGHLISINNQTREVMDVTGSTLTVDLPFIGSGSGLELLWGTPHTWESALVTAVVSRFGQTDDIDPDADVSHRHEITDDQQTQTHIDFRVSGFIAARRYDWRRNILIGKSGRRHVLADSPQTFIAGGFTDATAGLPELTGVAYRYQDTDPYDGKNRHVSVVATQPNPPIALFKAFLRRFTLGDGTVQVSSGVLMGTGTAFLTDLDGSNVQVIVGAQTLVISAVTDDTHATISGASTDTGAGQTYYISLKIIDKNNLRTLDYHPVGGGQIEIVWGEKKTKKLLAHIFRTTIEAQNGQTRNLDDNFTSADSGSVVQDTVALAAPPAPRINPKPRKIKIRCAKPGDAGYPLGSATFGQFIKNEIAARVKDGGGTIIGYIVDSDAGPTNSASEVFNDVGPTLVEQFNWSKTAIQALHPTGATIEFYNRVTNGFGVSPSGTSGSMSISTWEADSATPTPGALAFPGSLFENTVDGDPEKGLARITIVLATANGLGFDVNNIREFGIQLLERNDADTAYVGQAQSFMRVSSNWPGSSLAMDFYLRMGRRFEILNAVATNGDKETSTPGSLKFIAGGVRVVESGDTLSVPAPTYQVAAAIDGNKHVTATIRLTQNGTDIVFFKKLIIEASTNSGAFERIGGGEIGLKSEDALYTSSTAFKDFSIRTHRKPSSSFQLRARAIAVGGKASANTDSAVLGAGVDDGATTPTAIAFPSAPTGSNNSVDGDPDKGHARIALTLATASGTFTANNVSQIEIVLIRRNATNSADVGSPFSEIKVLSTADLAASSCVHEFFLRMGQKFRITKVVARNGDKRAETTGTADFTAGGVLQVDTGDAKTVAAPSFFVQPTPHDTDSNKEVDFTVRLTQDGTDIVLYKRLVIERQTASGGWKLWTEVPLKANDPLHASVTGSADFAYVSRRKAGKTVTFRATAYAVGGKASATTTSTTLAASGSDLLTDTAAPFSLPTPTLKFKRGKLFAKIELSAVVNLQTLNERIELSIHNGTNSLNLDDPTSESIVSGIVFYMLGKSSNLLSYDKDQLLRIFGSGANLKSRYRLTNNIGSSTTGDSANLPLSDQRDLTTLYNPTNLLKNGHFVFNDGSTAKVWQDYSPASGTFGILDNTGKMRLDPAEHRAKWRDISSDADHRFMVQNLGKTFFKSEYYSFTWNIYSNGTPTIDELVVGLYTQKTLTNPISATGGTNTVTGSGFDTDGVKIGTVIGRAGSDPQWRTVTAVSATSLTVDRNWAVTFSGATGRALIPQSTRLAQTNVALSTADKFQKGTVLTDSDLDVTLDILFVVVLRDVVDTTTFPFIDAVCMNPGQESGGYQRSFDTFETNFAGAGEDFDTAPTGGSSSGGAQPPGGTGGDPGEILPILT